jgi:hypothetical protein
MFLEFETLPHVDTLKRLLEEIEESMLDLLEHLMKNKKFKNNLINNTYHIAIDGSQKFSRDYQWDEKCISRKVGTEKNEQYYVNVVEAVLILVNGMTLPFMTEFLKNDDIEKKDDNTSEEKRRKTVNERAFIALQKE